MARTKKRYLEMPEETDIAEIPAAEYSVGIYSRLSVDHDDRKSESIENQIEIIRQYIISENSNSKKKQRFEVYDTYIDRGISGTSFERAEFDRLMRDVRNRNVNCIIVKDLSRFGRNYLETGNYIEKVLPFLGVRFIAVTDGFDSMSENVSEKKLAMNIKNLLNDMYAKDISKKVIAARKSAAERGAYIGGTAPYGYTAKEINGIRKLVIHPENAEVVRYLFESYASGISYGEMSSYLYQNKVHRIREYNQYGHTYWKNGEILYQWNPSVIRGVLSNPVYAGRLVQCKRKPELQEGRKESFHKGENEGITVENSHEPVIEQELFDRVNVGLKSMENKPVNKKKSGMGATSDNENIFRHVLYCGDCGGKMHATYYKSRVNGKKSYSYYCRRAYYIDGRRCFKNYIKEEQLESFCREQIKQILKKSRLSPKMLTGMNNSECEKMKAGYLEEQNKIMRERQKISVQAATLFMQYKEGRVSNEEYSVFRENKAEYENFCEKRMDELKRKIRKSEIRAEEQNKFLRSLQKAKGCKKLNIQLVESLIEKITVSQDGVIDIIFRFRKEDGGGKDV